MLDHLLHSPQILAAAREQAAMESPALRATVEGLVLQSVKDHAGEEAMGAVSRGVGIARAAPAFPWAEEFGDLREAARFLESFDGVRARLSELSRKKEQGVITSAELQELRQTLLLHRDTLSRVQGRLGLMLMRHGERAASAQNIHTPFLISTEAASMRLADHHMALADAVALYGDLADSPSAAMRRVKDDARVAEAALLSARQMEARALLGSPASSAKLIGELEAHWEAAKRAVSGREGKDIPLATMLKDAPAFLPRPPRAEGETDDAARQSFRAAIRSEGAAALPLRHATLEAEEMLDIFMEERLASMGETPPSAEARAFFREDAMRRAVNGGDWSPIHKTIPLGDGKALRSEITPAGHDLASHFEKPYEGNGVGALDHVQAGHVRNLVGTCLRDEEGALLFNGLRHGLLDPYGVTPRFLLSMTGADLAQFLRENAPPEAISASGAASPEALAYEISSKRELPKVEALCRSIREGGARLMAKELAVAALVADESLYRRAARGEEVELPMNVLSLMTPDLFRRGSVSDRALLRRQNEALRFLENHGAPMELAMRNDQGEMMTARVRVKLRQFNFGIDKAAREYRGVSMTGPVLRNLVGWSYSAGLNNPALTDLVGGRSDSFIGGAVRVHLDGMSERMQQLGARKTDLLRLDPRGENAETARLISENDARIDEITRQSRLLMQCALQVKDLWRSGSFRDTAHDPCKMTARIALLCHMIGEVPIFGDTDGLARSDQMDAEVKYLAARLRSRGSLPEPGARDDEDRVLRERLALEGGERELRALNGIA